MISSKMMTPIVVIGKGTLSGCFFHTWIVCDIIGVKGATVFAMYIRILVRRNFSSTPIKGEFGVRKYIN